MVATQKSRSDLVRAFTCSVIIGNVSTKVDGGLSVRMILPELSVEEKAAVFELQNCELSMLLQQRGDNIDKLTEVKSQFDTKTPSQRLRAVLYVLYKETHAPGEFEDFYRGRLEALINHVKDQLPEQV